MLFDELQSFAAIPSQQLRLHADLLLMSATPIPRTLALTIYGDLDVSSLSEFPSGKRDVETEMIDSSSPKIDELIKASITSHHRVYIVVPQIEGQEDDHVRFCPNVWHWTKSG